MVRNGGSGFFSVFHRFSFQYWSMGSHWVLFASLRGLCQGDPLSPLLFIIIMEALSSLLDKAVREDFIYGFGIGRARELEVTVISYLRMTL